MASEKPEKKEKKDKKAKRSETDGVTKLGKKEKKERKEKKKLEKKLAEARDLDEKLQAAAAATVTEKAVLPAAADDDSDVEIETTVIAVQQVVPDLVPFAVPLADDKHGKKVLKCIRKSSKARTLKRGVKEVVKALRKSTLAGPTNTAFPGVAIIAGDIAPMDVISHLPVLCEDHNVPYIFVKSRAELGAAAATKRPTSVVMVCEKRVGGTKKDKEEKEEEEDEEAKEFPEAYKDLVKLVQKETLKQTRV